MKLIIDLNQQLEKTDSVFQSFLLKQDIERLEKLKSMVSDYSDQSEFVRDGSKIGWTEGDLHTFKMADTLAPFLRLFFEFQGHPDSEKDESQLLEAWKEFSKDRLVKLVGCL